MMILKNKASRTLETESENSMPQHAQLYTAQVSHKRLSPTTNAFSYGLYYLALPINRLQDCSELAINRSGLISFWEKDHGAKTGQSLQTWIHQQLAHYNLTTLVSEVILVAMPRVMGFGFNPISFWLCLNAEKALIAVLCEVNNTFGESHCYLCRHEAHEVIKKNHWFLAEKVFHVSPFFPREGYYHFKFDYSEQQLTINIRYHNTDQKKMLLTSLTGRMEPLSKHTLHIAALKLPFITIKTVFFIHWQALKLLLKRCSVFKKPEPLPKKLTASIERYES